MFQDVSLMRFNAMETGKKIIVYRMDTIESLMQVNITLPVHGWCALEHTHIGEQ